MPIDGCCCIIIGDSVDVRYIARTASPQFAIDAQESNELMWVDLDRAEELMQGDESLRVIGKIRRLL